jgi:pimeloyl-ACP methyl ester carboxylesterase
VTGDVRENSGDSASDSSPVTPHASLPCVIFSHGQDGDPWGAKIAAMAPVARKHKLDVESLDYRGLEPAARVAKLLDFLSGVTRPVILVGSSLGGHVAAAVSSKTNTAGMFLLAPAFYMPGYEQYTPKPAVCPIEIVHGWNDTIVPPQNSIRFAQEYKATLHLFDSDHRLNDRIAEICELFDRFLARRLND